LQARILACRGEANVRPAGCVISHGGKYRFHPAMRVVAFVPTHPSSQAPERWERCCMSAPH
jgi:hypothetical protein